MSSHMADQDRRSSLLEDETGYGWMLFAGTMLGLVGLMNFVEGWAAIANSHFFVGHAEYVFGDLNTWGWVALSLGVIQGLTAAGIFIKNQIARWVGVLVAGLNALAQMLLIAAYPFWSLALFSIDVLIIYGLIAYGRRAHA